jgi:glycosyltransferase involved in cell wall biosynthesis
MLVREYPNANVTLIPHGTFDTTHRKNTESDGRPMRLVTMGKFGTYKRLETLLRAFDILEAQGEFPGLELVIGGSDHPSTPGYLARVARERACDDQIRFAGYLPEEDIADFFGSARVSVFDYDATTGSSGVLHQTASYGAVPVFPRIGDFVDVCRDEGLGGVNYDPGDAEEMAAAIAGVLRDPGLADGIAEANRRASLGMPFSQVIARHMELFRELMGAPGSDAARPGAAPAS